MKKNVGVILAGGSGLRMGSELPKQFLTVGNKTILEHTLSIFQNHPLVDEIALVIHSSYLHKAEGIIQNQAFTKVKHILPGGTERYHSTLAALKAYQDTECNFLIHDAVRPLVSNELIEKVIRQLQDYKAVNVGIPVTDTLVEVEKACIAGIPDRSRFYRVQTPQGFDRHILQQAFARALQDPDFSTTDDCSVVYKYLPEEKIKMVTGDPLNIKITWPGDLLLLQNSFIQSNKK